MKKLLLIACIALFGASAPGEVFLRSAGGASPGGGAAAPGRDAGLVQSCMEFPVLYRETLEYNGAELTLEVGSAPSPYRDFMHYLAMNVPRAVRLGHSGAHVDADLRNGYVRRYLVVDMGSLNAVIFRMDVPKRMPKAPAWPSELPLPSGVRVENVIRYPARGAVYGAFSGAADRATALNEMASALRGSGWAPVSGELSGSHPQGELFLLDNPPSLLWIGVSANGNGVVYRRRQGAGR